MSETWQEEWRRRMADARAEARARDTEREQQEGVDAFDRAYYERFGRYPEESTLTKPPDDRRRAAIQALIDHGATEGERAAARAAMQRLDAPAELAADALELDDLTELADEEDMSEWLDERHEAAGGVEDDEDDDDYIPL